jgi:hypothetical protein
LDTTPFYPRPTESGIRNAIQSLFRVIQCVAPKTAFDGPALVRCVMGNKGKITTAEAMWAIHEIARAGGFWVDLRKSRPAWVSIVTDDNPPAGIQIAEGEIHVSHGFPDWADLYFEPQHQKIDEIRRSPGRIDPGRDLDDLMSISDLAQIVGKRPNTLRNRKILGPPATQGGGRSKSNLWHYLQVKPALEAVFGGPLPDLAEARSILSQN